MGEIYEQAALNFKPKKIKTLFIAESPPDEKKGRRYFYFENVIQYDYLFKSIMEVLYPKEYKNHNKKELLTKFKEDGFFLIDAVEFPINNDEYSDKERNEIIKNNALKLIKKIESLINKEDANIILIKKNVYNLLADKIKVKGFNVLNTEFLNYPSHHWQYAFQEKLKKILKK